MGLDVTMTSKKVDEMHGLCPWQAPHEDLMKICRARGQDRPGQL